MNKSLVKFTSLKAVGLFFLFSIALTFTSCCQLNSDSDNGDGSVAENPTESSNCAGCPSAVSGGCSKRQTISAKPDTKGNNLPKMIDYGAGTCVPCKMMTPILEELKTEFAGTVEISFIDVKENNSAAQAAKIRVIPTQIFIDASGKELFRHEGFFSKEQIVEKFTELDFIKQQG